MITAKGDLYGEDVTPDGSEAALWRLTSEGQFAYVTERVVRSDELSYAGGAFIVWHDAIWTVRQCQLARLRDHRLEIVAGEPCPNDEWRRDGIRFGHLHGSFAPGPADEVYFTDSHTVRRIAPDGSVHTLNGAKTEIFRPALEGEKSFGRITGLAWAGGRLFVAEQDSGIFQYQDGSWQRLESGARNWQITGLAADEEELVVIENRPGFLKALAPLIGDPRVRKVGTRTKTKQTLFVYRRHAGWAVFAIVFAAAMLIAIFVKRIRRRYPRPLHLQSLQ
jgi:hypothetical protein